jgi:hypothetical protein
VSEVPLVVDGPAENPTVGKAPGRGRWQVGLRTAFLLVAALGVWMAYFVNRRHNADILQRIKALVPLAHELVVDDPQKIAVVKMEEYWYGENRWGVYLPGGGYRLCVATRGIDETGFPQVAKSARIDAGRHVVALEERNDDNGWRVVVLSDDKELIAVDEPKDWKPDGGVQSWGPGTPSEQLPPEKPLALLRCRFMRMSQIAQSGPDVTTDGILVWIERVPPSVGKR